jgi:uncharacterized protein (DUF302 family)
MPLPALALLFLALALVPTLAACGAKAPTNAAIVHTVSSQRPILEIVDRIDAAAKELGFGVVTTHDLRAMLNKKGVAFDRDVVVVEVCNPHHARTVLLEDVSISTALPCRISIYREGETSILATMAPTSMIDMFGREKLRGVAQEVQDTIYAIMDKAAK